MTTNLGRYNRELQALNHKAGIADTIHPLIELERRTITTGSGNHADAVLFFCTSGINRYASFLHDTDKDEYYWGEYFGALGEALDDYKTRRFIRPTENWQPARDCAEDLDALRLARTLQYPTEMESLRLCTRQEANLEFETYGMEADYFDCIDGLEAVLIFDTEDCGRFFILRINGHWEANIGGMMEEEAGELIDLFDETANIFGFAADAAA